MSITIEVNNNYVVSSLPLRSSLNELNKWKAFVHEVIRFASDGKKLFLFTLSPQKYSLGYDLGSFEHAKIGKEKVLISYIEKPNANLLLDITSSEEFARGLAKIVLADEKKSFDYLDFVKSNYTNLTDELITLEDDGVSLYWYNPHFPKDLILEKMNTLTIGA